MKYRNLLIAMLAVCCAVARPAAAQESTHAEAVQPASQMIETDDAALATRVDQAFGLFESQLHTLDVPGELTGPFVTQVAIDGVNYTLELGPYSVRTADYIVMVQLDDGSLVPHEPGPIRTLRGVLSEVPGSEVAGAVAPEGLQAKIRFPDGDTFWVEPVATKVVGAAHGLHVVYHSDGVTPSAGECGTEFLDEPDRDAAANRAAFGGPACGTGLCFAELANDADFEFYVDHGATVESTEDRVNLVVNQMNMEYEADVDITHVISAIVVRTSMAADPYTNVNDSLALVNAVQSEWENNLDFIPRDITQLFTGINIAGSTIGRAFTIGGVCTSGAYSFSQSDCCGSLACSSDLHAHENGHVWNGIHCNGVSGGCGTMRTPLGCVNFFAPFTINRIENHRDSRTCLATGGGPALPFFDDFPTTTFSDDNWSTISGANIVAEGPGGPIAPPSAPNALNLDGSDSITTQPMDLSSGQAPNGALVSYWFQRTGNGGSPESGEDLVVEYLNNINQWIVLNSHAGGGPDMNIFEEVTILVDQASGKDDALHPFFRLRFRTQASGSTDDWFVDDVRVTSELGTTSLPFFDFVPENPPDHPVDNSLWTGNEGVTASTRGDNEPSPTLSLNLNGDTLNGESVRSAIMDTTGLADVVVSYWYEAGGTDDPPEPGDDLFLEYRDANLNWIELNHHVGTGANMQDYEFVLIELPEEAKHDNFRIRFRSTADTFPDPDDDWFVDNICVGSMAFCLDPVECLGPQDCDDGIACTTDDCVLGFCNFTENNALCDDGVGCTADACDSDAGGCVSVANNSLCDDGISCTSNSCDPINDCQFEPINDLCNDDNPCTDDICNAASGCEFPPNDICGDVNMLVNNAAAQCDEPGRSICNVFVSLPNPEDRLLSVGFVDITTNDPAGFHQVPAEMGGADTAPSEVLIGLFPELVCDSYVTIGLQAVGAGESDGTTVDPDFDSDLFNCADGCGGVSGGWFNSDPLNGQGDAGNYPDNDVLVAQFVVNSGFLVSGTTVIFVNDGMIEIPGVFECLPSCVEDLNGDGLVDAGDLAQLLGAWGPNPGHPADFNGDGNVNAADLAQLLGAWGPC